MSTNDPVRNWLAHLAPVLYYLIQVGVIVLTFTAGSLTGAVASYVNLRTDAEQQRAKVAVIENQMSDIRNSVAEWRLEDREFAAEMRKSISAVQALLMERPHR